MEFTVLNTQSIRSSTFLTAVFLITHTLELGCSNIYKLQAKAREKGLFGSGSELDNT